MNYQNIPDDVLERHLIADPNNIKLILEAAKRFPRVNGRADDADLDESNLDEANDEIIDLKGEIEELKTELESRKDDLQDARDERDEVLAELGRLADATGGAKLFEPVDVVNHALKVQTDLQAEIKRLNTVLELVADA